MTLKQWLAVIGAMGVAAGAGGCAPKPANGEALPDAELVSQAGVEGYLAKDVHSYLADEVATLGTLVDDLDGSVHAAVHGDPWHENWLAAPDRLWLLDWEELSIGDPVVDDAILRHDALGTDPHRWPDSPAHAVARRALMLDATLDVAADWVEHTDPLVRRAKEAAYTAGLEAYRDQFS